MHAQLRPHRHAAHVRDPDGRLNAITIELAEVERDLRTAAARVRALVNEPSIRTLPAGGLAAERDRWAADRRARQQAAAREARERLHREQEKTPRMEPLPPSRSTPGHGWGIGR